MGETALPRGPFQGLERYVRRARAAVAEILQGRERVDAVYLKRVEGLGKRLRVGHGLYVAREHTAAIAAHHGHGVEARRAEQRGHETAREQPYGARVAQQHVVGAVGLGPDGHRGIGVKPQPGLLGAYLHVGRAAGAGGYLYGHRVAKPVDETSVYLHLQLLLVFNCTCGRSFRPPSSSHE